MTDTPVTRTGLATLLAALDGLAGWSIYTEPPELLARGNCLVISPRDPYIGHSTFGQDELMLGVTLLVPRAHGPALDVIDPALLAVRGLLSTIRGATIGATRTGIIDEVGGLEYVAAMTDVTLS